AGGGRRVGGQAVLKRLALLSLVAARAAAAPPGLAALDRLTAGGGDQLLGTLDPSGQRLYYVSNENATNQLFVADVARRAPTLLFDEAADVTWPRVSPDGRRLLYVSYQQDAAGQVCVRELGDPVGERRCLPGEGAALQAVWLPDSKHALMV